MRNKPRLYLIALSLLLLHATNGLAQLDAHFSQYYISPMMLNPALTGLTDGDYRVSAIFRSQFANTLLSKGASADMTTGSNGNFGLDLFDQSTSDGAYNYYAGHLNYAYTGVRWGHDLHNNLSLAIQAGFFNRYFDVTKMQFGDQWTAGLGYQSGNPGAEPIAHPTLFSFDAGVGAMYFDTDPDSRYSFFGGVAAFHLSRPGNAFINNDGSQLPIRYSAHAGLRIRSSDLLSIVPNVLYMREGNAEEKMAGAYIQLYVTENTDFLFGANWRIRDAISPFVGVYTSGLTIGMSYDVTATGTINAGRSAGSYELSISYTGKNKRSITTRPPRCPRF